MTRLMHKNTEKKKKKKQHCSTFDFNSIFTKRITALLFEALDDEDEEIDITLMSVL